MIIVHGEIGHDGWPKLSAPARVNSGTFGVGISSRCVVEAAMRAHEYACALNDLTSTQSKEAVRNHRYAWVTYEPLTPYATASDADSAAALEAELTATKWALESANVHNPLEAEVKRLRAVLTWCQENSKCMGNYFELRTGEGPEDGPFDLMSRIEFAIAEAKG